MPSQSELDSMAKSSNQTIFVSVLMLSLILWFLYRGLFRFPVVFDETLGKLIFFGLPVWIYLSIVQDESVLTGLKSEKIVPGLLRGIAFGGIFGFTAVFLAALRHGGPIVEVPLFIADRFWYELFLAILTAFWESLFFFGFLQTSLKNIFTSLDSQRRLLLTAFLFLLFHIPNTVLRFSGSGVGIQVLMLYLFGLGQALLYDREKNLYTLIMTHTIWGMVLLIHF